MDEVALSDGELYTILTNAIAKTQQGSLIAMVKGVKSDEVLKILYKIPLEKRKIVKEISVDMANNMEKIAREGFPESSVVTDRFHVAQLVSQAVQDVRIKLRWEAIEQENEKINQAKEKNERRYISPVFANGDTKKQLLARSRYLLFKPQNKWTTRQQERAKILFIEYPSIEQTYKLSISFRNIYENAKTVTKAKNEFDSWYKKVDQQEFLTFKVAAESIKNHEKTILNYFVNRTTNALAESFNSKIKAFRTVFRGVKDIPFFIFRLTKLFA